MHDHGPHWAAHIQRLNDPERLKRQLSGSDLSRILDLRGDEDVLDLGSGSGFYTDLIAPLTTGTVYALELLPEMNSHYRERGLPGNVRLLQGDMTALALDTGAASAERAVGADRLAPASVDVVFTNATWHEIAGRLDVAGVAELMRPGGRLLVVDWRKNPDTWESGPPENVRYSTDEVTATLASHFTITSVQKVGPSMFALTARRR